MKFITALILAILFSLAVFANEVPNGKAEASIDLATVDGAKMVNGIWKYSDTKIIETDFKAAGEDNQPTGNPVKTYDYTPHAGGADFDDSNWENIAPNELNKRRGNGRISFNWYRINITIPETVNGFDTNGSTVVFQTALDDYAEIWVNGEISRYLGQQGGSVISGWNAPNRLVIGRNVKPGQKIQLAVFGINGPISNPPTNFIWVREANAHRPWRLGEREIEPTPILAVNDYLHLRQRAIRPRIPGSSPLRWSARSICRRSPARPRS